MGVILVNYYNDFYEYVILNSDNNKIISKGLTKSDDEIFNLGSGKKCFANFSNNDKEIIEKFRLKVKESIITNYSIKELEALSFIYCNRLSEVSVVYFNVSCPENVVLVFNSQIYMGTNNNAGLLSNYKHDNKLTKYERLRNLYTNVYKTLLNAGDEFIDVYLSYKKNDVVAKLIMDEFFKDIKKSVIKFKNIIDPSKIVITMDDFKYNKVFLDEVVYYIKEKTKIDILIDLKHKSKLFGLIK